MPAPTANLPIVGDTVSAEARDAGLNAALKANHNNIEAHKAAASNAHPIGAISGLSTAGQAIVTGTPLQGRTALLLGTSSLLDSSELRDRATHTGTQPQSSIAGLPDALNAKAPLDSPAFTGTPTGITKAHVGLGDVDNTADADKPVSGPQAAALAAITARLGASGVRPGRAMASFVTGAVGAPDGLTGLGEASGTASQIVAGLGDCAVVTNTARVVAPREAFFVHPGRVYCAYFVSRRLVDTPDPAGDTLRLGLRRLGADYAALGTQVIEDRALRVTDGIWRKAVTFSVGAPPLGAVDFQLGADTVSVRPFMETFNSTTTTAMAQIQILDITEAASIEGALDAIALAQVVVDAGAAKDAAESAALSAAESASEALLAATRNFPSIAAAAAAIGDGFILLDGQTFTAGGLLFTFDSTAGDPIPDMPGVVFSEYKTDLELGLSRMGGQSEEKFDSTMIDNFKAQLIASLETDSRGSPISGRIVYQATDLVSLDVGDDPSKDNTAALNALLARPTAPLEIIQFPAGVIYHDGMVDVPFKSVYWRGAGKDVTIFKLRPQVFEINNFFDFNFSRARGIVLQGMTFDSNKQAHDYTDLPGQHECLNIDNWTRGAIFIDVKAGNCREDAFDFDRAQNCICIDCEAFDPGKDGFHNSTDAGGNIYIRCKASGTGGSRGAFTQTENSTGGNQFILCSASGNNSRGFDIRLDASGRQSAVVFGCVSYDNNDPDNLEGVEDRDNDSKGIVAAILGIMTASLQRYGNNDILAEVVNSNRSQGYVLTNAGHVRQWQTLEFDASLTSTRTIDFDFEMMEDARVTINGVGLSGSFSPTGGSAVGLRALAFASMAYSVNNNQVQVRFTNPQPDTMLRLLVMVEGQVKRQIIPPP